MDCKGKFVPQRWTYGCKGSQLSHRGPDAGNKTAPAAQRIEEDGGEWGQRRDEG